LSAGCHVEAVRQVDEVRQLVERVLGDVVLGMYLHGSGAQGAFKPASDLDVLVVTCRSLDGPERHALVSGLLPISGPRADGRRSVELTVVVQSQIRPWRYPPQADFLYGDWLRTEIETNGPPQPEVMPNLAIEIPQVLASRKTVSGPNPEALLDPVPVSDTVRGSLDGIPSLLGDLHADTRNVVLTLSRIWATVATGRVMSKETAAMWALRRLPPDHRPVLEHALLLYLTSTYAEEQPWAEDLRCQVDGHVSAVLRGIERVNADPNEQAKG
jgi:streptomycin 3"-adenylyltransferase